jgi:hypothetical protein
MKKLLLLFLAITAFLTTACNDDDGGTGKRYGVSFAVESVNIIDAVTPVNILFSTGMPSGGFVTVSYTANNVAYGTDFTTDVPAEAGQFTLPFNAGATSIQFNLNKLANAVEGEVKNVVFTITQISLANVAITGNESTQLNFNDSASLGGQAMPNVGGSNEPNQVYFDLSTGQYKEVVRTSWDLGFYSGTDFRVVINGSLGMAVKQVNTTNIDIPQTSDATVAIGTFDPTNLAYVDSANGALTGTAVAEVSANDDDNKVYIVNMGYSIPTIPASPGSISVAGAQRGWKKIRVLKNADGYTLEYADIAATAHSTVTITKDQAYNFTFFSLANGTTVQAEPQKAAWDLNFTTFTNEVFSGDVSSGSYFFSDFVVSNTKGGVRAYQVLTSTSTYDSFTLANVTAANFDANEAQDQRAIGANWRNVIPIELYSDRFYVIKDPAGNIYKLRFTAMLSQSGDRGNPQFQYALLQ